LAGLKSFLLAGSGITVGGRRFRRGVYAVLPLVFDSVVFDWSGTLSDDAELCCDARNRLVAKHGKPPITAKEYKEYYRERDLVKFYEKHHGIKFESQAHMTREYEKALKESPLAAKPFPNSRATLAALKKAGARLFVLSAHPQSVLEREAREYGFHGFFEETGFVGSVWDKTETLKRIVRENALSPSKTLFVGDVVLDVESGKLAGVRTCAATYGYHPRGWLEREKPDFVIDDVSELVKIVGVKNSESSE
jgi:phosphoglycolate phosphatase